MYIVHWCNLKWTCSRDQMHCHTVAWWLDAGSHICSHILLGLGFCFSQYAMMSELANYVYSSFPNYDSGISFYNSLPVGELQHCIVTKKPECGEHVWGEEGAHRLMRISLFTKAWVAFEWSKSYFVFSLCLNFSYSFNWHARLMFSLGFYYIWLKFKVTLYFI